MGHYFLLIALALLTNCKSDAKKPPVSVKDEFNVEARKAFTNVQHDWILLREDEQCVLRQTILNELDSVQGKVLVVANDLEIRRYYIGYLSMHFHIAKKGNKFYFLFFPDLYAALYNSVLFYDVSSSYLVPKQGFATLKLNMSAFNELVEGQSEDKTDEIFSFIFSKDLKNEISDKAFVEIFSKKTDLNLMAAQRIFTGTDEARIIHLKTIGFILFTKTVKAGSISYSGYFISEKQRNFLSTTESFTKFHCP